MTEIQSPKIPEHHEDRLLSCEFAMQVAVMAVVHGAQDAGWGPEEVAGALVNLADNNMLAVIANAELEDVLAMFRKRL